MCFPIVHFLFRFFAFFKNQNLFVAKERVTHWVSHVRVLLDHCHDTHAEEKQSMSENTTATREEEGAQKEVAERKELEVDDTEPEDEPETANDGTEQDQQGRGVRGRRGARHEHKHQMRWTDTRVMELMRCAAEMERPPNVAGWGKVITSFQTLLGIVQRAPNAAAVWDADLKLLTTPKLHNKFEQVLRQVHSNTYRPDDGSPASFMDDLRAVVKQLTDKQKKFEESDDTERGRWDAALRRVSEAWAAASERTDLVLSKRRIATAKQLLLGVRRMTPVYDEHGAPLFPPLVRWNFDTNTPEVVSLSDAPNTPHTARAFRESLGQGSRGRRGGGTRRSIGKRRSTAAVAAAADDDDTADAADSQATEYSTQADTEEGNNGEQVDSSTDDEEENEEEAAAAVAAAARRSSVGGRRGRRRSMVVEIPARMRLRKRERRADDDEGDDDEDEEDNTTTSVSSNNMRMRTLMSAHQQVPLAHCLGTGTIDDDVCLCRLTRTELLSYGVAITGFCPDCKHKLSYHS